MTRRTKRQRLFHIEALEDRVALSGGCSAFGQWTSYLAQNGYGDQSFGQHTAEYAQQFNGLGEFNRAGGFTKTALGC